MAFRIAINGEQVEGRTLAESAITPEAATAAVESLKVIAAGVDASIDLVAASLGRPRAWVANNVTAEEMAAIIAALMAGAQRGG